MWVIFRSSFVQILIFLLFFSIVSFAQTGIIFSSNSASLGIRTRIYKRFVYEYKLSPSFQTSELNSILQINDTSFVSVKDKRFTGRLTFQPSVLYIIQRNERVRIYAGPTVGLTYNWSRSESTLDNIVLKDNFLTFQGGIQIGTEFTPFEKINKLSFVFELIPTVNFTRSPKFFDEQEDNFFSGTILPRWGVIYYLDKR